MLAQNRKQKLSKVSITCVPIDFILVNQATVVRLHELNSIICRNGMGLFVFHYFDRTSSTQNMINQKYLQNRKQNTPHIENKCSPFVMEMPKFSNFFFSFFSSLN